MKIAINREKLNHTTLTNLTNQNEDGASRLIIKLELL